MKIPLVELLLLGLLGLVFVIAGLGHYKFGPLLNGPLISICVGIAFSAIVVYGGATQSYTSILRFKPEIFLYVLLPTIITDGALNVDVHLFLLNFGTICNTAFLGTTISAFIIGVLQWGFGQAKICYAMPFLPNLLLQAHGRSRVTDSRLCQESRLQTHPLLLAWSLTLSFTLYWRSSNASQ
mmetsp:Transcript_13046/g.34780  ORF Transcript_13046/g.34780 Transcript_13046/m.34780 type:complete len:182 (+) Transcript_13046:133-678(+)